MAGVSSRQAAQARNLRVVFFFHILYSQSIVPKFETANFEIASNDCIIVDKS